MPWGRRSNVAFHIGTVLIIGPGLIGGSFALGLKASATVGRVLALDRDKANLTRAISLGIVDAVATLEDARHADLVMVSVPVGSFGPVLSALQSHLGVQTVITDVGSTKSNIVEQARQSLGLKFSRFVPGHPISGSDASGAAAASALLFNEKRVVLTPVKETDSGAIDMVAHAWAACGARVERLSPMVHDRILAVVSHLPHVLAYALVERVARDANPDRLLDYSAGAFRDVTRIAASNPELWRDVCLANRDSLLEEIGLYQGVLNELATNIKSGNGGELDRFFSRARELKNRPARPGGKD